MPCYDPDDHHHVSEIQDAVRDTLKKLDERTDMLCRTCESLEKSSLLFKLPPDVHKWWREHQLKDAKRHERGR